MTVIDLMNDWKHVGRAIFKDPITDDGTKKSKKGLLRVVKHEKLEVVDQQTWAGEQASLLQTVFLDGKLVIEQKVICLKMIGIFGLKD